MSIGTTEPLIIPSCHFVRKDGGDDCILQQGVIGRQLDLCPNDAERVCTGVGEQESDRRSDQVLAHRPPSANNDEEPWAPSEASSGKNSLYVADCT